MARVASIDPAAIELSFWESIKNSSDPQDFKAYLSKYPDGVFADLARRRSAAKLPNAPAGNSPPSNPPNSARRERPVPSGKLRGIRDYYVSVPERFLDVPPEVRAGLLQRSDAIVDIKNGYISLKNDASDRYVLALFKRAADTYLIALSHTPPASRATTTTPAAPAVSKFLLLRYEQDEWSDVTGETLPVPFDPNLSYELPRFGTTISVTNRAGVKVYDLIWANGRFNIKRER